MKLKRSPVATHFNISVQSLGLIPDLFMLLAFFPFRPTLLPMLRSFSSGTKVCTDGNVEMTGG